IFGDEIDSHRHPTHCGKQPEPGHDEAGKAAECPAHVQVRAPGFRKSRGELRSAGCKDADAERSASITSGLARPKRPCSSPGKHKILLRMTTLTMRPVRAARPIARRSATDCLLSCPVPLIVQQPRSQIDSQNSHLSTTQRLVRESA